MKEKPKFIGSPDCWECGRNFVRMNGGIQKARQTADEHERKYPGFRRVPLHCRNHNYGTTVIFDRDCEY